MGRKMGRMHSQLSQSGRSHSGTTRFVEDAKHLNDILILRLADKLRQSPDMVQCSLSVGETHNTSQPAYAAQSTGVIPSVL